jgi:hypothetical protein
MTGAPQPHILLVVDNVALARDHRVANRCRRRTATE